MSNSRRASQWVRQLGHWTATGLVAAWLGFAINALLTYAFHRFGLAGLITTVMLIGALISLRHD